MPGAVSGDRHTRCGPGSRRLRQGRLRRRRPRRGRKDDRLQDRGRRRPGGAGPGARGLGQRQRRHRRPQAGRRLPPLRRADGLAGRRGAALQPDHPGRQGVRGRDDRAVPDQRPALLRRAADAGPRRLARTRSTTTTYDELLAVPLDRELPGVRRLRALLSSRCSTEQEFFEGEDSVGVVAADSPVNRRDDREPRGRRCSRTPASSPRSPGSTPPTPARSSRASTQAAVTFRSKGIDRVMFLGGVPARRRSSRPSPAAQDGFPPTLRDLQLRQPDVLREQPRHDPGRDHGRAWSASASTRRRTCRTSELPVPDRRGRDGVPRHLRRRRHHLRVPRVRARRAALLRRGPAAQARRRRHGRRRPQRGGAGRRRSTATARTSRPRPASATRSATAVARPPAPTGCCGTTRPRATSSTRATRSPFDDE